MGSDPSPPRGMSRLAARTRKAMNRDVIEASRLVVLVLVPCRQVT